MIAIGSGSRHESHDLVTFVSSDTHNFSAAVVHSALQYLKKN